MNIKFVCATVFAFFAATMAQAATVVECGLLNADKTAIIKSMFDFNSEDDNFSGSVGDAWQMSKNEITLKPTPKITARIIQTRLGQLLLIKEIISGNRLAHVGRTYEIQYLYTDIPILTIKIMGGIAGGKVIGTYECIGASD